MRNAYCPSCGHIHKYTARAPENCTKCGAEMSPIASASKSPAVAPKPAPAQPLKTGMASKWKRRLAEKRGLDVDDDEEDDYESDVDSIPNISRLSVTSESSLDGVSNTKIGNIFGGMDKLEGAADAEINQKNEKV